MNAVDGRPQPAGWVASSARGGEVVVGYDETPVAEAALDWAATRASSLGLRLLVVYVANPPVHLPLTSGAMVPTTSVVEHTAAEVARRGADRVRRLHPRLQIRSRGIAGTPAAELILLSQTATFVVLGHPDGSGQLLGSAGSVSFALSLHARCPVVLVPLMALGDVGAGGPVVVGVDSSRASDRALDFAASIAERCESPLVVVSAWRRPEGEPWMGRFWADPARTADLLAGQFESAQRCVDDAVTRAVGRHPGLGVVGQVLEGEAPQALLRQASEVEAAVLVVGSRGLGGFAGLMLGSVSRAVLRLAEVPVAVVREGAL